MWPIKGHHKKCHILTKDRKWHWQVCPDTLQLQGLKKINKQRNVTTPSDLPFLSTGPWLLWLHVDIPTAGWPQSRKTWGSAWGLSPIPPERDGWINLKQHVWCAWKPCQGSLSLIKNICQGCLTTLTTNPQAAAAAEGGLQCSLDLFYWM